MSRINHLKILIHFLLLHYGKVNCNKLNVRLLPEVGNNVLDVIDKDSSVTIIDELGDFYKIRLDNGSSGYVMKEFIDLV